MEPKSADYALIRGLWYNPQIMGIIHGLWYNSQIFTDFSKKFDVSPMDSQSRMKTKSQFHQF